MDELRYRDAERRLWSSVDVRPTERLVPLGRVGGSVRVQEIGSGPPVLFVHGASNGGTSWAPLVARLAGFRCLVVDRPGCGLSEPLTTKLADLADLERFADTFVVDVLDGLDLERSHLVATSFGGYFAFRAAAAHPDRVDRVVELCWSLGAPLRKTPMVMCLSVVPGLGRLMVSIPPNARMVKAMFRNIGLGQALDAGRISEEILDWYLSLLRDTDTMGNELRAVGHMLGPLKGISDEVDLPAALTARVEAPTFFLWGDEDPMGGADVARAFAGQFPDAQLELVAGAGHAVWLDDPDLVAARTRSFLDG
jgi:pimeloyl-ACP methyl ester carboxylesterase